MITANRNSDKSCIIFLLLLLQLRDWEDGIRPQFCKSHNFWNFYWLFLGVYRGKELSLLKYSSNFMKSHTMIVKTLSEHIGMAILHLWVKNEVFEQKWFHLSKLPVFHRSNSNGYKIHSQKIWAWSDHFSRFHMYWKFKIYRNRNEWCKTFLMSIYIYIYTKK